jgi:hypothetical protein
MQHGQRDKDVVLGVILVLEKLKLVDYPWRPEYGVYSLNMPLWCAIDEIKRTK